uniref:Uncharacterized protein n=1 Tax=Musa acuminata TaxID=4641 RepID=Q1EP99_MUSAC|nr:hypothetical protein MA4_54N07.46 [Musa acuminata]
MVSGRDPVRALELRSRVWIKPSTEMELGMRPLRRLEERLRWTRPRAFQWWGTTPERLVAEMVAERRWCIWERMTAGPLAETGTPTTEREASQEKERREAVRGPGRCLGTVMGQRRKARERSVERARRAVVGMSRSGEQLARRRETRWRKGVSSSQAVALPWGEGSAQGEDGGTHSTPGGKARGRLSGMGTEGQRRRRRRSMCRKGVERVV